MSNYVSAGFDLSHDILRLIQAVVIRFSIDQQPYSQGYLSVVNLTLQKRYGLAPSNIDTGDHYGRRSTARTQSSARKISGNLTAPAARRRSEQE